MVFIHSILQKLRSALKNERGEANYFSTVVFIFIAVVLLAFIIDLFGITGRCVCYLPHECVWIGQGWRPRQGVQEYEASLSAAQW